MEIHTKEIHCKIQYLAGQLQKVVLLNDHVGADPGESKNIIFLCLASTFVGMAGGACSLFRVASRAPLNFKMVGEDLS